jgi:hypothetical protein
VPTATERLPLSGSSGGGAIRQQGFVLDQLGDVVEVSKERANEGHQPIHLRSVDAREGKNLAREVIPHCSEVLVGSRESL